MNSPATLFGLSASRLRGRLPVHASPFPLLRKLNMQARAFLPPAPGPALRWTSRDFATKRHHRRFLCSATAALPRSASPKPVLRPKIAVVGGGHAGLAVALRLASMPWTRLTRPSITLIDRSDRFVFLPMLYELALSQVAQWEVAPKFNELLGDTAVNFVRGDVENVNLNSGTVEGTRISPSGMRRPDGDFTLPFDRVVLAVGAEVANLDVVEGAAEHALPFIRMADALALKERLALLRKTKAPGDTINAVVVGGGYSGVEMASCLAEELGTRGSVLLIESSDSILRNGTNFNRKTGMKALTSNGVAIVYDVRVTRVGADEVSVTRRTAPESGDGGDGGDAAVETVYPADVTIWTAGSQPSSMLGQFDVALDDRGRADTDIFLQVRGAEDRAYALGDGAVATGGGTYEGTAQVAVQQADVVAWNAWASLTGGTKRRNRYIHLGEMMVLGRRDAAVTTSVGVELDGLPAWTARRLAYLARMPTDRHRARVAASWAINPVLEGVEDIVRAGLLYEAGV